MNSMAKNLLSCLLAALLFVGLGAPAVYDAEARFAVTNNSGFGVGASDPLVAVDITQTINANSASDLSTYSFTSQSFGTADADRVIIVGAVATENSEGATLDTVTIGGVTATKISEATFADTGRTSLASIYAAAVPTGTTGTVALTYSVAMQRAAIVGWRTIRGSLTASDTDTANGTDPLVGALDIPANGGAVGIVFSNTGSSFTWSGITEDIDTNGSPDGASYGGAHLEFITLQTGLDVSVNPSSSVQAVAAWASWGPG